MLIPAERSSAARSFLTCRSTAKEGTSGFPSRPRLRRCIRLDVVDLGTNIDFLQLCFEFTSRPSFVQLRIVQARQPRVKELNVGCPKALRDPNAVQPAFRVDLVEARDDAARSSNPTRPLRLAGGSDGLWTLMPRLSRQPAAAHNGLVGGSSPPGPTTRSPKSLVLETWRGKPRSAARFLRRTVHAVVSGETRLAEFRAQSLAEKILVLAPC